MGRNPATKLSDENRDVLQAFVDLWERHCKAPTYSQVALWVGLKRGSSVSPHVQILRRLGYIERGPHREVLVKLLPDGTPYPRNRAIAAKSSAEPEGSDAT